MLDKSKLNSDIKKIYLKINSVLEFARVAKEGRWKTSKCQQQFYCITGSDFKYKLKLHGGYHILPMEGFL